MIVILNADYNIVHISLFYEYRAPPIYYQVYRRYSYHGPVLRLDNRSKHRSRVWVIAGAGEAATPYAAVGLFRFARGEVVLNNFSSFGSDDPCPE